MDQLRAVYKGLAKFLPDDKKYIFEEQADITIQHASGQRIYDITTWKGYRFLPAFESETAKYAYKEKKYEENCVLIATFPKTGSIWGSQLIGDILFGHDEELYNIWKLMLPAVTFLEIYSTKKFEARSYIPLPRTVYSSHLPEELLNVDKIIKSGGKIICITRNPKDQAVSLYHFAQTPLFESIRDQIPSTWPEFFTDYISGKLPLITREGEWYPDYLRGWNKHRNNPSVLFVQFEDMKKDLAKEIGRIGNFLDVSLTQCRIADIAKKNSFQVTKESSEKESGNTQSILNKMEFFRKGEVGSWKDVFTVAQSELMDKLIEEKLSKTDIKFIYEI